MVNASPNASVRKPVKFVLLRSAPAKIGEMVVFRVAVWEVAALHAFWARANKGIQNGPMNANGLPWFLAETHYDVPKNKAGFQLSPRHKFAAVGPATPNGTVVPDLISGEADDIAVFKGTIEFRHDSLL